MIILLFLLLLLLLLLLLINSCTIINKDSQNLFIFFSFLLSP
jgi:hypothetical protein